MKLYLVQHGKAKSKEEDPNRPLTEDGMEEIRKTGNFLAKHFGNSLHSIHHSGKTRAQETAQALAEALVPNQGLSQVEDLKPLDDPSIWAERIKQNGENIMLVGHLPHLSKLAALLVNGDAEQQVVDFQNAGVVCLQSDDDHGWSVRWAVTPELFG